MSNEETAQPFISLTPQQQRTSTRRK